MNDRSRRIAGGFYGLVLGVVYALTASTINWFVLRDVPLRVNWPVVTATVLGTGAVGLALGVLTAWPESFVKGVIFGALGLTFGATVQSLIASGVSVQLSVALFVTFLSRAVLSAPIALAIRALTHWHEEGGLGSVGGVSLRYMLPAAAVVVGLLFGSLAQMSPEAKNAVRQTHRIMQNALRAATFDEMPPALRRVPDFQSRASAFYQLDQQVAPFSADSLFEVYVYFDNGFVVSCLYVSQGSPMCEDRTGI